MKIVTSKERLDGETPKRVATFEESLDHEHFEEFNAFHGTNISDWNVVYGPEWETQSGSWGERYMYEIYVKWAMMRILNE